MSSFVLVVSPYHYSMTIGKKNQVNFSFIEKPLKKQTQTHLNTEGSTLRKDQYSKNTQVALLNIPHMRIISSSQFEQTHKLRRPATDEAMLFHSIGREPCSPSLDPD